MFQGAPKRLVIITHLQVLFGDVGASRVQHIDDELPPFQQVVAHKLARADRDFPFLPDKRWGHT